MGDEFSFDILSKDIFERFYSAYGQVTIQAEVRAAPQFIDVLVELPPHVDPPAGLWGRMALPGVPTLFESFSKTISPAMYNACQRKRLTLEHTRRRQAQSEKRPPPPGPRLWIFSPGRPRSVLEHEKMSPLEGFPSGFYGSPNGTSFVVVICELPRSRETILLRLLGRGETLDQALDELAALPPDCWEFRIALLALLASGAISEQNLAASDQKRAKAMAVLSHIWENTLLDRGRAEGFKRGRKEGREEGRLIEARAALRRVLELRELPVSNANDARIEACTDLAKLERWLAQAISANSTKQALRG